MMHRFGEYSYTERPVKPCFFKNGETRDMQNCVDNRKYKQILGT